MNNNLITFSTIVTFDDIERNILGLARDGYRNKEMLSVLNLERNILRRHWWKIRVKLSTRTIAESVAVAIGKHVIGPYRGQNNLEKVLDARLLR